MTRIEEDLCKREQSSSIELPSATRTRRSQEKATVEAMIRLYCTHKEGNANLCDECSELLRYAHTRLERCKFGERKPTCERCTVHCYRPDMRERVRKVMRYSGPRMIFYHPIMAIRHLVRNLKK